MSSEFFKQDFQQIALHGAHIPYEKWFVDLTTMGNVGAGSVYLMVHELFHSETEKRRSHLMSCTGELAVLLYVCDVDRGLRKAILFMKKEEVLQYQGALREVTKEVCYATDGAGNYTTQLSDGWDVKTSALDVACRRTSTNALRRQRRRYCAKERARCSIFHGAEADGHQGGRGLYRLLEMADQASSSSGDLRKIVRSQVATLCRGLRSNGQRPQKHESAMKLPFQHIQAAHCEDGVTTSLFERSA